MDIQARIRRFSKLRQKELLATALVQQMAINYALFVEISSLGNASIFNNILDLIWQQLLGHKPKVDWEKQRAKLIEITPEESQFEGYGIWPALDACAALAELLSLITSEEESAMEAIVTIYFSTIDQCLLATGEERVESHPLYEQAAAYLSALIAAIGSHNDTIASAKDVKALVNQQSFSNIGIEA